MGHYSERVEGFRLVEGAAEDFTEVTVFSQPWYWRRASQLLHVLDRATWKITDIDSPLERWLEQRHRRSCDQDCGVAVVSRRREDLNVPPMPAGRQRQQEWRDKYYTARAEVMCVRQPLEVEIATRLVTVERRRRRELARVPVR